MTIRSLWIHRKDTDPTDFELLTAWDASSIDENPEGWAEDCAKHLRACGDDVEAYRYIEIHVLDYELAKAFLRPVVMGEVR